MRKKEEEPTTEELEAIKHGKKLERFETASNKDLNYLSRLVFGDVSIEEMLKR